MLFFDLPRWKRGRDVSASGLQGGKRHIYLWPQRGLFFDRPQAERWEEMCPPPDREGNSCASYGTARESVERLTAERYIFGSPPGP
jgi:hypothetical protein